MQTIKGRTMLKRVWDAAQGSLADKAIVAWPERYPDLDQNNVLERFRRISNEFPSRYIIRLTSDCPLLTSEDINEGIKQHWNKEYWSNHKDGHDVQIFTPEFLFSNIVTSKEHVIADFSTKSIGLSVNTKEDLKRVRQLAR
jgi:GTP:adenosylcobinamide-phosphate guanylyltransferase